MHAKEKPKPIGKNDEDAETLFRQLKGKPINGMPLFRIPRTSCPHAHRINLPEISRSIARIHARTSTHVSATRTTDYAIPHTDLAHHLPLHTHTNWQFSYRRASKNWFFCSCYSSPISPPIPSSPQWCTMQWVEEEGGRG